MFGQAQLWITRGRDDGVRFALLADAERQESDHSARGARGRLPHHPLQHRQRGPVCPRILEAQSQSPNACPRRPRAERQVRERSEVIQWVFWQMANQGPKLGECGHFRRLSETKGDQSYAVRRFTDEANRLYGVLNNRLYDRRYLAGDEYTIADMICYPWTVNWEAQGQDINEFPYVRRWLLELGERPAVQRGMAVGGDWAED